MENSGTEYLSLHIVKCWRACEINEENKALPLVLYCSYMIYKYYSCLGFTPIKYNEKGKKIHN